jgi:hypothetical protein
MAKYTGISLAMSVGGVMIAPANELKSVEISSDMDTPESTGATDLDKTYHAVQRGHTAAVEAWSTNSGSTAGSAGAFYLFKGAQSAGSAGAACIVYPSGSSAGLRTRSFNAFVSSISEGVVYNDVTPLSVTLQITGAVTDATL